MHAATPEAHVRRERQTAAAAKVRLHRPTERGKISLCEGRSRIKRLAGQRLSHQIRAENSSRDHVEGIVHAIDV